MPSGAENRKNRRRSIAYRAYIDLGDGSPAHECLMCDASQHGALLETAEPHRIPDEFTLALSVDGVARRKCLVVRRTRRQIGVQFLKDDKKDVRPIVLPVEHAGEPAAEPEAGVEIFDTFDIDTLTPR